MSNHTQGEWQVRTSEDATHFQDIIDDRGRTIAEIAFHRDNDTYFPLRPESETNAKLIAAAPDLLSALQLALAALEGKPCRQQAIDDGRAATAKATA